MSKFMSYVPNSAGLVVSTLAPATGDLVHTLSQGRAGRIAKVMWYNNTGATVTMIIGAQTNATPAVFVPLFPTITCVNGQHDVLTEKELLDIVFRADLTAAPNGRLGTIAIQCSALGVLVRMTIKER